MIGDIYKNSTPISSYQPSKEIVDFTTNVKTAFSEGVDLLNRPWIELNNMSVLERKDRDQRTFNAFVDESVEDPSEVWKWRGTRSKARNKAIQMHAQLTAGYIIPMFMAQNEDDEEDRVFSDMMRDMSEWTINNSDYKSGFLMATMGMLVNPVTYMGAEYADVYQTIKEKTKSGYAKKEVIDDVLSGFNAPVYSTDQILISNAFEQNIQKQTTLIKRRYIDYTEAEARYGEHENWVYVSPGTKSLYSDDDGMFYDVKDDDHPTLVEEAIYLNRREDCEVAFVGGIYMGDTDVENGNPIKHRDHKGNPKYNVTPFGYQRINEHFYFYKSLTNAHYWDNQLLDAQYEMGMNRIFLDTNMPLAISGTDNVDSDIIFPSSITAFADKDAKVSAILPQANISNIFSGMNQVERSMEEASVSDLTGGQQGGPAQTATATSIANFNAKIMLQGVGKTLAESIVQYGNLMKDIIINHMTIPQVMEIAGSGATKLKYRTFVLNKKQVGGKEVSKTLKFDESLLGKDLSGSDIKNKEIKMLDDIDYPDHKNHVYRINPELFAKYNYMAYVEPERMFPKNEEFMQAMLSQIYTQLRQDPLIKADQLVRKTLYAYRGILGDTDDMMQEPQQEQPPGLLGIGADAPPPDGAAPANVGKEVIQKVANKSAVGR